MFEERNFPAEKRERGAPGAPRRQPRGANGSGQRFSYTCGTALDGETYAALDAAAKERRVTRSYFLAEIVRDWARGQSLPAVPADGPSERAA
jgi:hypothetical protein